MTNPIIEIEDKQPDEKISLSLRPEIARSLRAYSEYAHGSSLNHVVTAALKRLFDADKGFRAYQTEHPDAGSVVPQRAEKIRHAKGPREVHKASATA
jgi:hypothetical protein